MKSIRTMRGALLVTVAAFGAPGLAHAQAAPDGAVGASANDEIVVTARKREESLQDVPISVQAFSGAALEQAGIKDFSEIAYRVPGLKLRGYLECVGAIIQDRPAVVWQRSDLRGDLCVRQSKEGYRQL